MKHYPRRHRHLPCDAWEGIKNLSLRFFYQPRLGDVIGGSYNFSDATGHIEIVTRTFPGSTEFESTGAHRYGLGTTDMGYKMVNKQSVSNNRVIIYNPVKISRPN